MPYATTIDRCGEGPSLVLVHGTPLDAHAWEGVVPPLADRRRVVTYDLRGHGSARATPVPDSYRVLAHDLAALLDMLGLERATSPATRSAARWSRSSPPCTLSA